MAHELSHILLRSLMHKERDNEFYTDLTAMILGFSNAMLSGRKVIETDYVYGVTTTTTYGYFSDDKFNFAFNKISEILKKNIKLYSDSKDGAFQKLVAYEKRISSYKKELLKFKAFLEYLDKNPPKRIKGKDGTKIVQFNQLDYADRFTAITRGNEEELKKTNDFCAGLPEHPRSYSQQGLDSLRVLHETIDTLISGLKKDSALLNDNVNTLRKYVSFIPKLKINRQATLYKR